MVPGGRVELPTPAFSGPRSTGELPRHGADKRFYEAGRQDSRGRMPDAEEKFRLAGAGAARQYFAVWVHGRGGIRTCRSSAKFAQRRVAVPLGLGCWAGNEADPWRSGLQRLCENADLKRQWLKPVAFQGPCGTVENRALQRFRRSHTDSSAPTCNSTMQRALLAPEASGRPVE